MAENISRIFFYVLSLNFLCLKHYICVSLYFSLLLSCKAQSNSTFQVGVVLDSDSLVGRIGLSCLKMGLSDFYSVHSSYTTKLVLHIRDSKGQIIDAAASGI